MVSWFAGLFYMVRLFIYHVEAQEKTEVIRSILTNQFSVMKKALVDYYNPCHGVNDNIWFLDAFSQLGLLQSFSMDAYKTLICGILGRIPFHVSENHVLFSQKYFHMDLYEIKNLE